jgi:hypothetical protein
VIRGLALILLVPWASFGQNCDSPFPESSPKFDATGDFVELSRLGCRGTCPIYSVTIHSDGKVQWDGKSFVETKGHRNYMISPDDARRLIKSLERSELFEYCREQSSVGLDGSWTRVELFANGRHRILTEYYAFIPDWLDQLQYEIDQIANTHLLRHGDPPKEPLLKITLEYAKPGFTELMEVVRNFKTVQMMLTSGARVDDVDSSGWTALMYAAANSGETNLLLQFGADPKHVSPYGDTV